MDSKEEVGLWHPLSTSSLKHDLKADESGKLAACMNNYQIEDGVPCSLRK